MGRDHEGGPLTVPRLAAGARLQSDRLTGGVVLLYPEGVVLLNGPAAAVLQLCDGQRTLVDLVAVLGRRYRARPEELSRDVAEFLSCLRARGLLH
jgi:pyrroloquinoline quinone biosynthesis protein D